MLNYVLHIVRYGCAQLVSMRSCIAFVLLMHMAHCDGAHVAQSSINQFVNQSCTIASYPTIEAGLAAQKTHGIHPFVSQNPPGFPTDVSHLHHASLVAKYGDTKVRRQKVHIKRQ